MTMPLDATARRADAEPPLVVRVFLFDIRPAALAVAALVRATLDPAEEELRSERDIVFRSASADRDAAMARTVATVDRFAPGWRNLVEIDRLS